MEGLKDALTQRGANFDIDDNDHEHPNAAFKRLTTTTVKKSGISAVTFWYLLLSMVILILWFVTSDMWRQMWHFEQQRSAPQRPWR
jgi:hypothetical protein